MDSAELINCELKCLGRWLKSNKISNADKTKYMLFSYGKDVNFPDISVGNNIINERGRVDELSFFNYSSHYAFC